MLVQFLKIAFINLINSWWLYTNVRNTVISSYALLVRRLRSGELVPFTEIFNGFTRRLLYAAKVLDDRDTSEDMIQDLLLLLWVNRGC